MTNILEQLQKVKIASKTISNLSLNKRNFLIKEIALVLDKNRKSIIKENKKDLDKISENYLLKDRLLLNDKRINSMINSCYELIKINDPLKKYDIEKTYVTKEKIKIKKSLNTFMSCCLHIWIKTKCHNWLNCYVFKVIKCNNIKMMKRSWKH